MGNSESSHDNAKTINHQALNLESGMKSDEVVRGRKSQADSDVISKDLNVEVEYLSATDDSDESEDSDSEEEDMDDVDAGLEERRQILEDARMLKQYATFHLRPEQSVVSVDPFAKGRNFFDRPSAEMPFEDFEERALVLEEAKQLKTYATFHLHPEEAVVSSDGTATARNFFSRPAADQEPEEIEERARILDEARQLKQYATFHLHPEKPVENDDDTSCARNYFSRPAAAEQESEDDGEEREKVLEEATLLKKFADFHLHPEKPVELEDAAACGRDYFSRSSAAELSTMEEMEARNQVLADCLALKTYADYHLHPEKPVARTESTVSGRNYFMRASAPPQETAEDAEECKKILEEVAELKKNAVYHLHPEKPVECTDSTAFGRNYFCRESAVEPVSLEEEEERSAALRDARLLQKYAEFHLHPEKAVEVTDNAAQGRDYFSRPSAAEHTTEEEMEEREQILAECLALKKFADFHLHPEKPVKTTDGAACARNYFSRPAATEFLSEEDTEEQEQVMADCASLRTYAGFHLHPEVTVQSEDATIFGRNYYDRASAVIPETVEESEEREIILQESALLKNYAGYHLHPEKPVEVDSTATARDYFSRPSASQQVSMGDSEERDAVLNEAAMLREYASYHLHPEQPVVASDSTTKARDFFSRPAAIEQESLEDDEERTKVLEEANMLKQYATFHLHPEKAVESTDSTACGRNYFSRASASEQESLEEDEERMNVLEEAMLLKKYAGFHLHPEKPMETLDTAVHGRNYFSRSSAPEQMSVEDMKERDQVLADCVALKNYASFHLHPEKPVETLDSSSCARNYFGRASANVNDTLITSEGRALSIAEVAENDEYDQHLELDEKLMGLSDFRASITKAFNQRLAETEYLQPVKQIKHEEAKEEGDMSRSPSSIMLFGYDENQAY